MYDSAAKLSVDEPTGHDVKIWGGQGRGLLHSFYPGESTFINQAVTEIDIHPKVL